MDATTIATVALVLITAYYAWQTRATVGEMRKSRALTARTVEEMERGRALTERTIDEMRKGREATDRTVAEMVVARELAPMPTLVCHLTVDVDRARRAENFRGDATLAVAADYSALVLTNVGNAPALDVVARVGADPPDRGRLRVRPLGQRVGIVGLATEWRYPLTFTQDLIPELLAAADPHAPLDPLVVVHASYANAYGRRFTTRVTFDLVLGPDGLTWEQRESVVELLPDENGSLKEMP